MSSCLCDNAYKGSLATCRKNRDLSPVSKRLSVPIQPACANQGLNMDQTTKKQYLLLSNSVHIYYSVTVYTVYIYPATQDLSVTLGLADCLHYHWTVLDTLYEKYPDHVVVHRQHVESIYNTF